MNPASRGAAVSCEEVRDALLAGRPTTDAELVAHAETCAECAPLFAADAELGRAFVSAQPSEPPDPALWAEIARVVEAERGPRAWLRSRPTGQRLTVACVAVLLVTALGTRHLRPDFVDLAKPALVAWLVAFVATAWVAVRAALPVLGRAPHLAATRALELGLGLPAVYALAAASTLAAGPVTSAKSFVAQTLGCFGYGLLLSAPLIALLWLLDRGAGPRRRLLSAAAACGLAANAALVLHCPSSDPLHLMLGHAAIAGVLVLAAWLLSAREPRASDAA